MVTAGVPEGDCPEALATLFATTANCLGIGEGMPHYVNRFVPNVDQARAC
jgi:hypothetical protein